MFPKFKIQQCFGGFLKLECATEVEIKFIKLQYYLCKLFNNLRNT